MTTIRLRTLTLVGLVTGVVASAQGQVRHRLTLVDLLNVPRLTNPQLSPDGRQLVYELASADWKAGKRIAHIWRVGVDGTGTVQMTDGAGEQGARWSPDGRTIVYIGKRGGEESQIFEISNGGGEGHALTHHATSVHDCPGLLTGATCFSLHRIRRRRNSSSATRPRTMCSRLTKTTRRCTCGSSRWPRVPRRASPAVTSLCSSTNCPRTARRWPSNGVQTLCSATRVKAKCG